MSSELQGPASAGPAQAGSKPAPPFEPLVLCTAPRSLFCPRQSVKLAGASLPGRRNDTSGHSDWLRGGYCRFGVTSTIVARAESASADVPRGRGARHRRCLSAARRPDRRRADGGRLRGSRGRQAAEGRELRVRPRSSRACRRASGAIRTPSASRSSRRPIRTTACSSFTSTRCTSTVDGSHAIRAAAGRHAQSHRRAQRSLRRDDAEHAAAAPRARPPADGGGRAAHSLLALGRAQSDDATIPTDPVEDALTQCFAYLPDGSEWMSVRTTGRRAGSIRC